MCGDTARADGQNPTRIDRRSSGPSSVVAEYKASQGVVSNEVQDRWTIQSDEVFRSNLPAARIHIHCSSVEHKTIGRQGGGRNDHRSGGAAEIQCATVDDGAARVAVGPIGQRNGASAGGGHQTHRRCAIVNDGRIDGQRAGPVVEVQILCAHWRQSASRDLARVSDRADVLIIVGPNQATSREIERISAIRKAQGDVSRHVQRVQNKAAGRHRRRRYETDVLGGLVECGQHGSVIACKAHLIQRTHSHTGRIGGKFILNDRPPTHDVVGQSRGAFPIRDDNSRVAADQAHRPVEEDGGT